MVRMDRRACEPNFEGVTDKNAEMHANVMFDVLNY